MQKELMLKQWGGGVDYYNLYIGRSDTKKSVRPDIRIR